VDRRAVGGNGWQWAVEAEARRRRHSCHWNSKAIKTLPVELRPNGTSVSVSFPLLLLLLLLPFSRFTYPFPKWGIPN